MLGICHWLIFQFLNFLLWRCSPYKNHIVKGYPLHWPRCFFLYSPQIPFDWLLGYRLLRDPKEIYIVEIMRIMDGPVAMLPCVSLNYYQSCEECDEKNCAIKGMFKTIRDKTLEVLGGTSLHDLNHQWWRDHHLQINSSRVYANFCSDHLRRVMHCMH